MVEDADACAAGALPNGAERRHNVAITASQSSHACAPARSPITPLTEQVMIRDSIAGARIAVIEGRGHEIYVDDADGCINALLKFLRALS